MTIRIDADLLLPDRGSPIDDGHSFDLGSSESSPGWIAELCDGVPSYLEAVRRQLRKNARSSRFVRPAASCPKSIIRAAVETGFQTIEHGSYLDEETAALMTEQGTIYAPTRLIVDQILQMGAALPRYAYEKRVMVADHHTHVWKWGKREKSGVGSRK